MCMWTVEISIIIPIYNVEDFIEECLESILCQTIEQSKIEAVLVDDGSTDRSGEIASNYAQKYNNFIYIHKKNGGLSSARNAGLDKAQGRYVIFLDSDDILKPYALEELYLQVIQNNCDLILFGAENFREGQETGKYIAEPILYKGNYNLIMKGCELYKLMYASDDLIISACWVIVCKDLIDNYDIRFIDGIQYEDHWYNFLLLLYAQRVRVINSPLYNRRIHNESITSEKNYAKKFKGMVCTLKKMDELSQKIGFQGENESIIESEIIRIASHAINALTQIKKSEIGENQLNVFKDILKKHKFWKKGCLLFTVVFGVSAGIWFRKHVGN